MSDLLNQMMDITRERATGVLIEAKIKDCLSLATKIADEPYAYDRDGQEEFRIDCQDLKDKLSELYADYLNNRERK